MRKLFFELLLEYMKTNPDIWVLTGDLGYGLLDEIRSKYPERFINCGASEQAMMGIAVGLAQEGKIPFVYSITPFLLLRPFETIRTYINHEKIPVKLVGGGRDDDYKHDGFSHYAGDDDEFMSKFKNIHSFYPQNNDDLKDILPLIIRTHEPVYINLKKK